MLDLVTLLSIERGYEVLGFCLDAFGGPWELLDIDEGFDRNAWLRQVTLFGCLRVTKLLDKVVEWFVREQPS